MFTSAPPATETSRGVEKKLSTEPYFAWSLCWRSVFFFLRVSCFSASVFLRLVLRFLSLPVPILLLFHAAIMTRQWRWWRQCVAAAAAGVTSPLSCEYLVDYAHYDGGVGDTTRKSAVWWLMMAVAGGFCLFATATHIFASATHYSISYLQPLEWSPHKSRGVFLCYFYVLLINFVIISLIT